MGMVIDKCRDIEELEKLYNDFPMNDGIFSFDFIANNPHLYCFYGEDDGELKAYASIYTDETGKLFFSGASVRKNMADNTKAIIKICEAFNDDMYADTDKREAKIALYKAGFRRLNKNLYVRYKNG